MVWRQTLAQVCSPPVVTPRRASVGTGTTFSHSYRETVTKRFAGLLLGTAVAITAGCASSTPSAPPSVDVTGDWTGTWVYEASSAGSGTAQLSLKQTGSTQDRHEGVISRFSPAEPMLIPGLRPGEERRVKSGVSVFDLATPGRETHSGSLDVAHTYIGTYAVTVPAGKFDASLLRWNYAGKIGPASVNDVQYWFVAKGDRGRRDGGDGRCLGVSRLQRVFADRACAGEAAVRCARRRTGKRVILNGKIYKSEVCVEDGKLKIRGYLGYVLPDADLGEGLRRRACDWH